MDRGSLSVSRSSESAYEVGGINVDQLALALAERLKPPEVEKPFFGELADEWFEFIRSKRVAPDNEERHIRRLKELFLETEDSLTPAAVAMLLEAQTDYSPSSRNKLRGTGRLIIDYAAARQRWSKPNPFSLVKREKEPRRTYELLTLQELFHVQRHLRIDRRRLFRVALHTGMRPGELMGLRVDDIDFPRHTIHVRRSRDRDTTKTGEPRDVPIHPAIATDLLDACVAAKGDLVFGNHETGGLELQTTKLSTILRTAMKKARVGLTSWKLACRRSGCGHVEHVAELHGNRKPRCPRCDFKLWAEPQVRDVRWYDLRHICATLHHEHGADPVCVKIALGHSLEGTTEEIYTHPTMTKLGAELSKWKLPQISARQAELPLTCEENTR